MTEKPDRQKMPEVGGTCQQIETHNNYWRVLFDPKRGFGGKPNIKAPGVIIGLAGKEFQAVRIDPFEIGPGAHWHLRPVDPNGGENLEFPLVEGKSVMDSALYYFFTQGHIRTALTDAGAKKTADRLKQSHLDCAADGIRAAYAKALADEPAAAKT